MKLSELRNEMEVLFRKSGHEVALEIIEMIDYIFNSKVMDDIIINRIKMLYKEIKSFILREPKIRPLCNNSFINLIDNVDYFRA